eukprot:11007244-Prorocentrum_lima.AAC.1
MTSSLVGSEMCIRDRASTAGPVSNLKDLGNAAPRRARHATPDTQSFVSVSYTHLTLPTICSV